MVSEHQAVNIPTPSPEHESELPRYPSKEYLDKLLQMDYTQLGDKETNRVASWCRNLFSTLSCRFLKFYLLPNGSALRWWTGFRLCFAVFACIFAPAQLAFPIDADTSFYVIFGLDIVAWLDM